MRNIKIGRFILWFIVLSVVAFAVGIMIIFAQLAMLESALAGRKQSFRLTAAKPLPLADSHPALPFIHAQLAQHARPESLSNSEGWKVPGEFDGDGKPDWIDGHLEVHLTATSQTLRLAHGSSELRAIGLGDVDGDGAADAWWADPGDLFYCVCWGAPQDRIVSHQSFELPSYGVIAAAFLDVDGDGRKDFVYLEENRSASLATPPQRRLFWIKMAPAR